MSHATHDDPTTQRERPDNLRVWLGASMAVELGPLPTDYADGTVVATSTDNDCTDIEVGGRTTCVTYTVRLTSGEEIEFSVRPT